MTIAYTRVSTDKQNLENQKHKILSYANDRKFIIDDFVEIEISSKGDAKKRLIDSLFDKLKDGDTLICTELSRLGRNMLEILNLIHRFNDANIKLIFVNQPELSTNQNNALSSLLLAIYGYFAQTEREIISERTKQGLEAAKKAGKKLGRPKGARAKVRVLDPYNLDILELLNMNVAQSSILKIINNKLDKNVSLTALRYHVENTKDLRKAR
ncbi:MAG: recombinase family protein, partial [Arcobacteraceae bacterium]|nr:recombinase family protein [Arcobacteraceae bacterium]